MKYYRTFPRYKVSKLKGKITFPGIEPEDIILEDISIGGLQIRSKNKLIINDETKVEIFFLKEKYQLSLTQIWMQDESEEHPFQAGFKITHYNLRDFHNWLKLLKAMHLLKQKRQKNASDQS